MTQKRTIKKPKLLRSNPSRFILLNIVDDYETGRWIDDESIYVGFRRPAVVKDDPDDDWDLSDDIKFRLWLARQLVLMKASGYDLKTRATGFSFGRVKFDNQSKIPHNYVLNQG